MAFSLRNLVFVVFAKYPVSKMASVAITTHLPRLRVNYLKLCIVLFKFLEICYFVIFLMIFDGFIALGGLPPLWNFAIFAIKVTF